MLNRLDMGRSESVLTSQDEECAAQLCSSSAVLLALFCLLCKYVTRERIISGSRSATNHLSKNTCISVYFGWMGSLPCFTAQPPQQLCQNKKGGE